MAFHLRTRFCKFCNNSFFPERQNQTHCCIECLFLDHIDFSNYNGCWEWKGRKHSIKDKFGAQYGQFDINQTGWLAHRVMWTFVYGEIPNHPSYHGYCVCHKCDNRGCVNPDHLFLGLNKDNIEDRNKKGRQSYGESHPNSKLSQKDIADIRKMIIGGFGLRHLGRQYGVDHMTISAIRDKKTWMHV